ncbi:MAG: metallophosphoesterase [Bacteroidales bacterium]|jgi:predicted MPP superfamily phosphohydrolase|nr:metallophosphoesterase [Bacteroidales bacterium]
MKTIMFVLIALSIYIAGNVYLYVRCWQALEVIGRYRLWYAVAFWTIALLFIAANFIRTPGVNWPNLLSTVSSAWIAVMLYGTLALAVIDIVRLTGWAVHLRPASLVPDYPLFKLYLFAGVLALLATVFIFGYRNARFPKVTPLEIFIDKQAGEMKELKIAMVSDLHLGRTAGIPFLRRVIDRINELDPDVVLLAGDTFDGDSEPVIRNDMCREMLRLKNRFGVYAIPGNHEYIGERFAKGSAHRAFEYLDSRGVTVLIDTAVQVNNSFYIAGRDDRSVVRRKSLADILPEVNGQPVILLDHQPFRLEEAQQAGVDLQLSGHTHHGQMFPLHLITEKMYEQDWGALQKGHTHYYISCGAGTWGPVLRTAGYSEIVFIKLTFSQVTTAR